MRDRLLTSDRQRRLEGMLVTRKQKYWTSEQDAQLTELWLAGQMSTTEIGKNLEPPATKNAVVGRAHRLHLPKKESAVRGRWDPNRPPRAPRERKVIKPPEVTLPLLASEASIVHLLPPRRRPAPSPPRVFGPVISCLWPEGDPKHPGFCFCGDKSLKGRSYCKPHCEMAYVAVPRKINLFDDGHSRLSFPDTWSPSGRKRRPMPGVNRAFRAAG